MAVGMTLNQLYAHPTYADHADGGAAGPAPSAASSAAASAGATSSAAASAPASDPAGATPPIGRSPGSYAKPMSSKPVYGNAAPPMETRGYPAMPTAYAPYPHAGYPRGGGGGGGGSEEYMADPLPFEYSGMRRFHPGSKDMQERMLPPAYADSYTSGGSSQHHPVYTATSVSSDRGQVYSGQQAYDPRAQYAPEIPAHYPPGMPRPAPYGLHGASNGLMPLTHAFPPLLDPQQAPPHAQQPHVVTKKEVVEYAPAAAGYMGSSGAAAAAPAVPVSSGGASQEAMIKVKTPLKLKYWRNGRRNLQCFPSCKVFGDYSAIKIEDLKQHDFMWGKCRGSIVTEVTLNSNVAFDDLVILGRVHSLENIPVAFEEAVIRECMLGRMVEPEVMDAMKDQWITGERLPDFVQQDAHVACYEFKPKVWKYTEDMAHGKCKRRNVKYYVQFEAFMLVMSGDRRYYACIGSGMSTSFEVGSSRVLARQKRKAASNGGSVPSADKLGGVVASQQAAAAAAAAAAVSAADMQQMHQQMHQQPQMMAHGMMQTHPMAGVPMYPPPYPQQAHPGLSGRGLTPTFPQMMGMPPPQMHDLQHQSAMMQQQQQQQQHPSQQHPSQQQQQQQQSVPSTSSASVGGKRKLSSERPPFPTDRAPKMLKTVGVAQSVPM